jgi:hypothetical protein
VKNVLSLGSDWSLLVKMLPSNWRELAKSTKAITRMRTFESEDSLMQSLLLHIAAGYSLRETATRLKMANVATVSDVALLKRLQQSESWFRELCLSLLQQRGVGVQQNKGCIRMRIVDGTSVKEPGKTGSTWKIHYSLSLPDLKCDYFKLTSSKGEKSGESLKQFPIKKGDCVIGDRGYSTAQGIAYVATKGGYSLIRVNSGILNLIGSDGEPFNMLKKVRELKQEHEAKEWMVKLNHVGIDLIEGRFCVIRKNQVAKEQAIKKMRRLANRRGEKLKPETEEMAGYVILFTTLPKDEYPLKEVLELYRVRWQIELVFKRLKSIAGLGHLPKHDERSARAWLYGKLFTGLMVEKLMECAKTLSPWGYL